MLRTVDGFSAVPTCFQLEWFFNKVIQPRILFFKYFDFHFVLFIVFNKVGLLRAVQHAGPSLSKLRLNRISKLSGELAADISLLREGTVRSKKYFRLTEDG